MADYPVSHDGREPEDVFPASARARGGTDSASEPEDKFPPQLPEAEIENLKRRLALYQKELDAIDERAAAIQRESREAAESIRREAEAKAQEIIRRATAEAELLELRARVRAEKFRIMEAAQIWVRMDLASEAAEVGGDTDVPNQAALLPPHDDEQEAMDAAAMVEEGGGARTSPVEAEEPAPIEAQAASTEPSFDLGPPLAVDESAVGSVAQACEHDDQGEVCGDQPEMAEETAEAEPSEVAVEGFQPGEQNAVGSQTGPSLASAARTEGESVPDVRTQPPRVEIRRYRVTGALGSASRIALEQAAGRIPGVLSAIVSLAPDGGTILTVSSHDARGVESRINQLRL